MVYTVQYSRYIEQYTMDGMARGRGRGDARDRVGDPHRRTNPFSRFPIEGGWEGASMEGTGRYHWERVPIEIFEKCINALYCLYKCMI